MGWMSKFGFAPLALVLGLNVLVWLFIGFSWLFFIALLLTLFLFRKPARNKVCEDKKAILAPMDSEILSIESIKHKHFGDCVQIIFKNALYNAGSIYTSTACKVLDIRARHGLFLSPKFELSSELNERLFLLCESEFTSFGLRFIAGSFDRKIKINNEKAEFSAAEELGFSINSRVALILPKNVRLLVNSGDEVQAKALLGYFE